MTKFILHGGGANVPLEGNKRFFQEIVSEFSEKGSVLLVYFAREKDKWPEFYKEAEKTFNEIREKEVILEIANSNASKFREQIKSNDAIYVRDGNTFKLLESISQVPDFTDLIKDKIYAGSSAGMYMVSKYFYENDFDRIGEGLGILPIKAFAHWEESKQEALKRLQETGEDLETIKLAEGEYVVKEQ